MSGFRVIVCGVGPVVRELATALRRLDFDVERCASPRPRESKSDGRRRRAAPPASPAFRFPRLPLSPGTFVVAATRDLEVDLSIIRKVLRSPAGFLAVLGSRSRAAALRRRLRADGFNPAELRRLHCPAGLPIRSVTPVEIGLSIAAQLVQERAKVLFGPAAARGKSR